MLGSVRTSTGLDGVSAVTEAAEAVGLITQTPPTDVAADLILVNPAGGRITVQVKRASVASADGLESRIRRWTDSGTSTGLRVLVADRISLQSRSLLRDAGWGWLDLRGHLHLAGEGLFIDADVPRMNDLTGRPGPLAGTVGEETAALMLLDPAKTASVRAIARTLHRAPSSVSTAIASLREAGLVDEHRRPVIPDLFWELAARWHPLERDVQQAPSAHLPGADTSVGEALRLGLENIEATTGWALTDTLAAAAYGAPVATRSGYPPDFYVTDQSVLRRAVHLLGPAHSHESRGATIRIAPFSMICNRRIDSDAETWPLARPLFVALDLARDPGRGREILDAWSPPPGKGHRVW